MPTNITSVKTQRAHYEDPLRLEDTVEVIGHGEWKGTPSVLLSHTIFYPESGGQLGDHGTIGPTSVVDVQLDAEGRVHHLLEGTAPPVGERVSVRVDELRRRTHMALHTGQHALSRAVLNQLDATTLSSRLGASACTLDVNVAKLTLAALNPVQDAVNRLIDEDRPVHQRFVDDETLKSLDLRKPPPEAERIRVVEIDGFDITPCGGTHATHTAQIEVFFIRSVESYKGGSRITFEAGPRARSALFEFTRLLRDSASALRCAVPEVPSIVEGLNAKLASAREEAGALRARLAELWAARLSDTGSTAADSTVVASIEDADPALLKVIAARLTTGSRLVALAAPGVDGTHVLISRGPDSDVSCGDLLRAVANASGGRGGGRPAHAQGRIPNGADFEALVRAQL